MAYKLATNEDGTAKVNEDGRVVYLDDTDNKEVPIDVNQMFVKINNLNSESAQRRRRINELEAKYAALDGIEDVDEFLVKAQEALDRFDEQGGGAQGGQGDEALEAARKRLQESFDAKLDSVNKAHEAKVQQLEAQLAERDQGIRQLTVAKDFASSEFFSGENQQTFLTPDMAEKIWGGQFKVEENNGFYRTVGYDSAGNMILSRENPGEPASFREAIGMIIDADPNKTKYMRATDGGTGAQGNTATADTNDVGVLKTKYKQAQEAKNLDAMLAIKRQLASIGHPNAVL